MKKNWGKSKLFINNILVPYDYFSMLGLSNREFLNFEDYEEGLKLLDEHNISKKSFMYKGVVKNYIL